MIKKVRRVLEWLTQPLLPAVGSFYLSLSGIWDLPYGERVAGSAAALYALFVALLQCVKKEDEK